MNERTDSPSTDAGHTTVLIVGAGPTGLTMAVELARAEIPFRLIDAEPAPHRGSRGKGVQPRTLEIFDDLGIADRVLAHGRLAMPMQVIAPDGQIRRGGAIPSSLANRPDIPYVASLITPQWRVEEALHDRLAEFGGTVEYSRRLVGLRQTDDAVVARLAGDGGPVDVTARWVVGADGGHSAVRHAIGVPFVGETREEVRMVLADLPVSGLDRDAWQIWSGPDGMVSLCPLPSTDLFQFAATLAPGADPDVTLAGLQSVVDERVGRAGIRLHEPVWTSVWRANVRLAERYRVGRVFLAGDAAHIHSPAGGQGMNTGIQDAHNLAWKLAAVIEGDAPRSLLDTYEDERRPVAAHVLALSDRRLAAAMRTSAVPVDRDASTIQLDVGYRGSALSRDDRDPDARLRAGDRAPDATGLGTVHGTRRLFDLINGGRFTWLSFGPASVVDAARPGLRVLRVVPVASRDGEIVDADGSLRSAYGASDRTVVLIRPDGHIAVISDAGDTDGVGRYLTALQGSTSSAAGLTGN